MIMDIRSILSALALSAAFSGISFADNTQTTWFGEEAAGQWLVGIKAGRAEPNRPGYHHVDTGTLLVGYQFARPIGEGGTASVELEMSTSNTDALSHDNEYDLNGHWETDTTAAFITYRTPGTVYFKAKGGIMNTRLKTKVPLGIIEESETDFAYGLGLGYRAGRYRDINIEGEWVNTTGEHDIGMINVGVHANF